MVKIEKRSDLQGAEKYGSCASCGKERDVYKITFADSYNNQTSISVCSNCLVELGSIIYDEYQNKTESLNLNK